ncbi:hypothetical protein [Streptantibioticus ferralitis]|uniref:Uncharacterized protein n=1 Tax=Streptantibioticus ferralitis TaxID=236510 RepID=A0ABT5Z904_9ACTN|nr:hypothetical protein [Streptantibioticus ferralitis]MDF2260284.1 hypothetical protein [Streptantibioticus ferralitis]
MGIRDQFHDKAANMARKHLKRRGQDQDPSLEDTLDLGRSPARGSREPDDGYPEQEIPDDLQDRFDN